MSRIYLSCGTVDLQATLERARSALRSLPDTFVNDRPDPTVDNVSAVDTAMEEIKNCDIFVGVYGRDFGPEDNASRAKAIEDEYHKARSLDKRRLIYTQSCDVTDERMLRFRAVIEAENRASSFSDTETLALRIVTDSSVTMGTLVKTPESKHQDDPASVKWVKEWLEWFRKNFLPDHPLLQGLLIFVLSPLLLIMVLVHFGLVPKAWIDWWAVEANNVLIYTHLERPRKAAEQANFLFSEPANTLSKKTWSSGSRWSLVPLSETYGPINTLSIVGSDIGYLKPPDPFTDYYDFKEDFVVLILNPEEQHSFTWLVRLQPSWTGKYSYYRLHFDFPDASTKTGKVSACLVVDNSTCSDLEPQDKPLIPFEGTFSTAHSSLEIKTVVTTDIEDTKAMFAVTLTYRDSCLEDDCPVLVKPTDRSVHFIDQGNELKWGTIGFTAPDCGSEAKISGLSVNPIK
jgi:hypothetical protein